MDINDLRTLISSGESTTVEFKKTTALIRAAFETVCAFLNGKGGMVLLGVNNNGQLIGQDVTDNTRQEIAREISKIEPMAAVDVEYILVNQNKHVVAIKVSAGEHAPYTYDSRAFLRNESSTSKMPQHRYEQLLVKRGQLNHAWEEFIADGYDTSLLDHEEIYRTVVEGIAEKRIPPSIAKESIEKILRQLELITDDGKLKRAAVVLFAKEIKPPYDQCWLKMARFQGINKGGDFLDNQQEYCNVFRMLDASDNFLHKHLPMASHFNSDQFKRIDQLVLPVLAVREALVNAMCHRDYSDRSGYISIAIFDDRVEIWSNGTLPDQLKLEDLKHKHDSILRNKLIAKVFYLRGYVEAWGTGIKRMMDSCKEHGLPNPKFTQRTGGFVVEFKFAQPIGASVEKSVVKVELSARQKAIMDIIRKHGEVNIRQIIAELNDPPSRTIIKRDLNYLKNNGFIDIKGVARNALWVLK